MEQLLEQMGDNFTKILLDATDWANREIYFEQLLIFYAALSDFMRN